MNDDVLNDLARTLAARRDANPETSYTAALMQAGRPKMLQKIGEEATEVVIAGGGDDDEVAGVGVERLADYLRISRWLRAAGIGCEVYPEAKKLKVQLQYADKRGFRIALVAGGNEFAENRVQVKDLANRSQRDASLENDAAEVVDVIREMLSYTTLPAS